MSTRRELAALVFVCAAGVAACQQAASPQQTAAPATKPTDAQDGQPAPPVTPQAAAPTEDPSPATPLFPGDAAAPGANATEASAPPPATVTPVPEYREVTVPAGTRISVILETGVSSDGSSVEDAVRGRLASAVSIGGVEALPAGSAVAGTVVEAKSAGKVKGRGRVAFRFDRLTAHGENHLARTSVYTAVARATKAEDAKKIGIGAGAGAIVGGIIGGGKGAAIGAGVGGGAGTGVVLSTKGEEARVGSGARVRVTLERPLTVRVPVQPAR